MTMMERNLITYRKESVEMSKKKYQKFWQNFGKKGGYKEVKFNYLTVTY